MLAFTGSYIGSFFRLVFPRICASCSNDLYNGESFICLHCRQAMVETDLAIVHDNAMYGMFRPFIPIEKAAAVYYYGGGLIIQRLMHEIKYQGNRKLAIHLGNCIGQYLENKPGWQGIDVLVPVPLHDKKRAIRKFNQSELICTGAAEILELPVITDVLYRKVKTATQTNRSRTERWDNVSDAFDLGSWRSLENKHILLVDDVVTTGATLLSCALTLMKIQGLSISLAAVAYAGEL